MVGVILPLDKLHEFCGEVRITSKEVGLVPLTTWQTQEYFLREIATGMEEGIHEFIALKGGRQEGISTISWVLLSWWLQRHEAMQGMFVAESEGTEAYARDTIRDIANSPSRGYKRTTLMDNPLALKWDNNSRLLFGHAAKRGGVRSNLGRSRGLNVLHATEVGSWVDDKGVSSLQSALSERHPLRLYIWESTANGYGVFHDMWTTALKAVTQRAVFIGWWLHENYVVSPDDAAVWHAYAGDPPTGEESAWIDEVFARYGVEITRGQLAWYRWKLIEKFRGDEAMMGQEYGCLPEMCFQAFGNRFIAGSVIMGLRKALETAPEPETLRYEWAPHIDETRAVRVEAQDAPLIVWEEPDKDGVYLIAGHPAFSSSPEAVDDVAQVWRVWPDRCRLVAEYCRPGGGPAYQFAWALVHLCGAYHQRHEPFYILELLGPGRAVLQEQQRLERYGFGVSSALRQKGRELLDFLASVRQYIHTRPDSLTNRANLQWQTSGMWRTSILHQLRDSVERGSMVIRSAPLVDELAALRQGGEAGDTNDHIGGSGTKTDSRVMCAAIANHMWLDQAVAELDHLIMPEQPSPDEPTHAGEIPVKDFFGRVLNAYGH